MNSFKKIFFGLIILLLGLLFWSILAENFNSFRVLFSSPIDFYDYFLANSTRLFIDIAHTLYVAAMGYILAIVIGFLLAFLGSTIGSLEKSLLVFSSIMQTIPVIVFVPFLIITIGPGFISKIILASLMSLFVILTSTILSLDEAKSEYQELVDLYGVKKTKQYIGILIPAALSSIVGNLRVAAGLSVLGAIVVEFTGSRYGLGKNIFLSSIRIEPELMLFSVIICCFIGLIIHKAFTAIEKKYFWWR